MSRASTVRVIPWDDKYLEFFDLVAPDWRAPATMRTVANAARNRLTCEARFTQADGTVVKLTSKVVKQPDGVWMGIEERLDLRMTFQVGGRA